MKNDEMVQLRDGVERELKENIIPFWLRKTVDHHYGGFIGRMSNRGRVKKQAPKGLILTSRILWTFSRLYRDEPRPQYLQTARRAFEYLNLNFRDTHYGGYYWMVSYLGEPVDVKKKVYGQAFVIYALAEFAMATHDSVALRMTKTLFKTIEKKCRDTQNRGYYESFNRDWTVAEDYRLSKKDMDEKKSMNTHLHLLEAYTNLYRIWKDISVKNALQTLMEIFQDHIIEPECPCFRLFFDEKWVPKTDRISFGHDIEGSWLLAEAAEVLCDGSIPESMAIVCRNLVDAVERRGMHEDGSVLYEGNGQGILDGSRHWWVQAEAVVGLLNAYQLSGNEHYLKLAMRCWQYIEKSVVDKHHGEWFWKVSEAGKPDDREYNNSGWKGPYHNVRACLEIMKRLDQETI